MTAEMLEERLLLEETRELELVEISLAVSDDVAEEDELSVEAALVEAEVWRLRLEEIESTEEEVVPTNEELAAIVEELETAEEELVCKALLELVLT